ncbi:hypothetical protein ACN38_g5536 [Penicillium nordicum]|uniref:Uncharacterized protein n=1 Tax=Penicillium nordicum TaxID=229535 RepID=A0A0M8P8P0_9EURO|nr:hypothetical protein ACN38_g5536 [Penicillium nordicum]
MCLVVCFRCKSSGRVVGGRGWRIGELGKLPGVLDKIQEAEDQALYRRTRHRRFYSSVLLRLPQSLKSSSGNGSSSTLLRTRLRYPRL